MWVKSGSPWFSIKHQRARELVSGAAGESGGPYLRRRENLPLSSVSAVDHPGDAELINKHAEAVGPEGLLDWHLHNPVFRQCVEYAFRIRRVVDLEGYGEAFRRVIA